MRLYNGTKSPMAKLSLNFDYSTLVDDELVPYLGSWKWSYSSGYARRQEYLGKKDGKRTFRLVYLHRLIMNAPKGKQVDHINGDTLDNRKSNLRVVTRSLNQHNRKISCRNQSGATGVYWHKQRSKWHAQVMVDRKKKSLGLFDEVLEATGAVQEFKRSHGVLV